MPMSFPDMASLRRAAEVWKFREPNEGETEAEYRAGLADFVIMKDPVESMEIRTGKGWNEWNDPEKREALRRTEWRSPVGTLKTVEEQKA